jgi:hypothetical protein
MGRVAASAPAANDREPRSLSQSRCWEYWSVFELTPPSAGLAAVRRVEEYSNDAPNLLADYLYLWETTVPQAIEIARASVSSGGHSSSYRYQQRTGRWFLEAHIWPRSIIAVIREPIMAQETEKAKMLGNSTGQWTLRSSPKTEFVRHSDSGAKMCFTRYEWPRCRDAHG